MLFVHVCWKEKNDDEQNGLMDIDSFVFSHSFQDA